MKPFYNDQAMTLYHGDALSILQQMPGESVQTCVTSPPYFGLRDYGIAGQMGLEDTPEAYVASLVRVFREMRRVLREDGTLWLNLGDSYSHGGNGTRDPERWPKQSRNGDIPQRIHGKKQTGLPPKSLIGIPWRVAFSLQADGWVLRSDVIWSKPSPMPESVVDRPSKSHEYIFLLAKSGRYHYDADSIREPLKPKTLTTFGNIRRPPRNGSSGFVKSDNFYRGAAIRRPRIDDRGEPVGANKRTVWTVASQSYPGTHFACVDDETEALTPIGWRKHSEFRDGDVIAAYDHESDVVVWQMATFHRYAYDGDLVAIEKRDSSQRLTPNHRCLIQQRSGRQQVVRADALKPGMSVPTTAPFSESALPRIGVEWADLVGWYITEGEDRYPGLVRLYQSVTANPQHVARIDRLLADVGAQFSRSERVRDWCGRESREVCWSIRAEVAERLQELAPEKVMTPALAGLPTDEAQVLLRTLVAGDGNLRRDGRMSIVQKDKQSIDLMQLLALRCGYRAHVSPRTDGNCHQLFLTTGRWLTLRGTNGVHERIPTECYSGTVWCPSVPSGFWLARRNGKPFITGNTFPPKLIEPSILAGCPEGGVVLDPFVGSGTTCMVAQRLGRRSIGIDINEEYLAMAVERCSQKALWFSEAAD